MITQFYLKLYNWDLFYAKKILSRKSQLIVLFNLIPSSTLNSPMIIWLTIPAHIISLLPLCCLVIATSTSELERNPSFGHFFRFIKYHLKFFRENCFIKFIFSCISWPSFDPLKTVDKKPGVWQPMTADIYASMCLRPITVITEMLISSWTILARLTPSERSKEAHK